MVHFLSINFFLDFFNFCWVFQKFPFFCVTLYNVRRVRSELFLKPFPKFYCGKILYFVQNLFKIQT